MLIKLFYEINRPFQRILSSEKTGGFILIACTLLSIFFANSSLQESYIGFLETIVKGYSITHWINDGLMSIFFLLIGLELQREIYSGELSNIKNALLPVIAAVGGALVPAGIYMALNYQTDKQAGAGIPMATDIAFAVGILSLLGKRVPASLKLFLTALAVIDDLLAILVIAILIFWFILAVCRRSSGNLGGFTNIKQAETAHAFPLPGWRNFNVVFYAALRHSPHYSRPATGF